MTRPTLSFTNSSIKVPSPYLPCFLRSTGRSSPSSHSLVNFSPISSTSSPPTFKARRQQSYKAHLYQSSIQTTSFSPTIVPSSIVVLKHHDVTQSFVIHALGFLEPEVFGSKARVFFTTQYSEFAAGREYQLALS